MDDSFSAAEKFFHDLRVKVSGGTREIDLQTEALYEEPEYLTAADPVLSSTEDGGETGGLGWLGYHAGAHAILRRRLAYKRRGESDDDRLQRLFDILHLPELFCGSLAAREAQIYLWKKQVADAEYYLENDVYYQLMVGKDPVTLYPNGIAVREVPPALGLELSLAEACAIGGNVEVAKKLDECGLVTSDEWYTPRENRERHLTAFDYALCYGNLEMARFIIQLCGPRALDVKEGPEGDIVYKSNHAARGWKNVARYSRSGYTTSHIAQIYVCVAGGRCTREITGRRWTTQHFFRCFTCETIDSMGGMGLCETCAYRCHRGHKIEPVASSEFYCDCGDKRTWPECICRDEVFAQFSEDLADFAPNYVPCLLPWDEGRDNCSHVGCEQDIERERERDFYSERGGEIDDGRGFFNYFSWPPEDIQLRCSFRGIRVSQPVETFKFVFELEAIRLQKYNDALFEKILLSCFRVTTFEVIDALLQYEEVRAKLTAQLPADNQGAPLLYWATMNGDVRIIDRMLEPPINADVNICSVQEQNVLMWAASRGFANSFAALYHSGADARKKDISGNTALTYAFRRPHFCSQRIVQMLIEAGNLEGYSQSNDFNSTGDYLLLNFTKATNAHTFHLLLQKLVEQKRIFHTAGSSFGLPVGQAACRAGSLACLHSLFYFLPPTEMEIQVAGNLVMPLHVKRDDIVFAAGAGHLSIVRWFRENNEYMDEHVIEEIYDPILMKACCSWRQLKVAQYLAQQNPKVLGIWDNENDLGAYQCPFQAVINPPDNDLISVMCLHGWSKRQARLYPTSKGIEMLVMLATEGAPMYRDPFDLCPFREENVYFRAFCDVQCIRRRRLLSALRNIRPLFASRSSPFWEMSDWVLHRILLYALCNTTRGFIDVITDETVLNPPLKPLPVDHEKLLDLEDQEAIVYMNMERGDRCDRGLSLTEARVVIAFAKERWWSPIIERRSSAQQLPEDASADFAVFCRQVETRARRVFFGTALHPKIFPPEIEFPTRQAHLKPENIEHLSGDYLRILSEIRDTECCFVPNLQSKDEGTKTAMLPKEIAGAICCGCGERYVEGGSIGEVHGTIRQRVSKLFNQGLQNLKKSVADSVRRHTQ